MNTKDFVVLPWGKPGNSIKLKYKNAQELRMEKVRLEKENEEMEKKLQKFRSARSKEKEEIGSSGYHWKSGKVGKLSNQSHMMLQNKGNSIKLSAGNVRLKLLKEQIQESEKNPSIYKMANSSRSEKPKIKGKVCGQCEDKAALLVCLECGEDYCSGCFAKIHQKGALKLHRTTLLQAKSEVLSSVLDVAHQFIKEANPDEPKVENTSTKESNKTQNKLQPVLQGNSSGVDIAITKKVECTNPRERLLREGSFSEEASAQSFQEVLGQWRAGNHEDKKQNLHATKLDSLGACEVQTNLKIWREPLNIEFKEDSLSYMEKLWLKKHRRTPREQLFNMVPSTFINPCKTSSEAQCSQRENDEDSDDQSSLVQNPALFLPVEELIIERPEPSLKIVELDDTYEEDFEEPGNVVPYKVELADADSQQSCTICDYQNSFLYENDIHQHHVLNKGRPVNLHLCLRNSFTYCKDNLKAGTSNADFDNVVDFDVYSDIDKIAESNSFKRNVKEKSMDGESNQKSDYSCISLENKGSLANNTDLGKPPIEEKLIQDINDSLEFSNLHKRPNFEDSKTTESPLLLQEIALRSKPIIEQYQGLERFFIFDKNERLNLLSSHSLECSYSRPWNTFADQKSQRPSTADLPVSNSVTKCSRCLSSSHSQSSSAAAQSPSRAASEVSEIEYVDTADQNEPFLDDAADQQTIASLEKELNVLRNLADPSEKLYSPTSEELPAFNSLLLDLSQTSTGCVTTTQVRGPCGVEDWRSSGKDTAVQSSLSLSESSTDEEDLIDKQQVITLPWSEST
ncbi:zinc finger B-box domain-containing protein 1 isoform X2 [Lepus europaeus]|uniref:zinc finger B-box domain-containing protein 1 isoform X2 n=1 Tax=Lepus europaeus TaxID=9983 RepID=UPI002B4703CF|nr:zinc finger B-box domain-containing protein 1 isoform X2 [Lepus europaeus]